MGGGRFASWTQPWEMKQRPRPLGVLTLHVCLGIATGAPGVNSQQPAYQLFLSFFQSRGEAMPIPGSSELSRLPSRPRGCWRSAEALCALFATSLAPHWPGLWCQAGESGLGRSRVSVSRWFSTSALFAPCVLSSLGAFALAAWMSSKAADLSSFKVGTCHLLGESSRTSQVRCPPCLHLGRLHRSLVRACDPAGLGVGGMRCEAAEGGAGPGPSRDSAEMDKQKGRQKRAGGRVGVEEGKRAGGRPRRSLGLGHWGDALCWDWSGVTVAIPLCAPKATGWPRLKACTLKNVSSFSSTRHSSRVTTDKDRWDKQ